MPNYNYKAMSATGENIKGSYTANTKNEVIAMLRKKDSYPLSIEENNATDLKNVSLFKKVKTKDIAVFCRQFYAMLNSGVTIMNSLEILRNQVENKTLREVTSELYEEVQKGATFSEALRNHEDVFPDLLIYMVAAGEASGSLDLVMDRMANHYEKENKINNKIKSAMVYPIILIIVSTLVVVFLLTFVMPTFLGMFEGSGVPLPLPTVILMAISAALRQFWYVFVLAIILIAYGIKRFITTQKGRLIFDQFKFRIPVVKGLTQKIVTARFTRTLSTLLASGIPLLQALENVANAVGNTAVAEGIMQAREDVRKGVDISTPIKRIGYFPPMVVSMIHIGEESGTLDEILDKTANFYDDEVETSMQKLLTMLEPLMIVGMAVVIGFIVISMVLPMFDMLQTVQ